MDVPNLEKIGLASELLLRKLARCFRRGDLDDRRISEIQLWSIDHRDQRSCHRHPRGGGALVCRVADLEVPEWPAHVGDAGDPTGQPDFERRWQPRLVSGRLLRIRDQGSGIDRVWPGVGISGLEKVDV